MDWAASNGKAVRQSPECEARDYNIYIGDPAIINVPRRLTRSAHLQSTATGAMTSIFHSISHEDSDERIER